MFTDYIIGAIKSIYRHKLRTFLTVIGILIGIASVVCVVCVGAGSKNAVIGEFDRFGIDGIIVYKDSTDANDLNEETLELLSKKIYSIKEYMPLTFVNSKVKTPFYETECIIWGVYNNYKDLINIEVQYGRHINKSDMASSANVCVIDSRLAMLLFKRENIVGKTVTITTQNQSLDLVVVGVSKDSAGAIGEIINSYVPGFIYMPFSAYKNICTSKINNIAISFKDNYEVEKSAVQVMNFLRSEAGNYRYENMLKQREQIDSIINIITLLISAIAGISLIVGGVGIMTIMLAAVSERKREIGIKKALGAKKSTIMLEFLCESLMITLFGGLSGIVFGILMSITICSILNLPINFNFNIILLALIFCMFIGIIFSVYPAKKAADLDPVLALKE